MITINQPLPIFISHNVKDLPMVMEIEKEINYYGIKCFIAHRDINVSTQWETEIKRRLRYCSVFITTLTKNFKKSDWCDQETGIAIKNGLKVVPLICDGRTKPYGFISRFQGTKLVFKTQNKSPLEEAKFRKDIASIVNILMRDKKVLRLTRRSILANLQHINSYHEAECVFS